MARNRRSSSKGSASGGGGWFYWLLLLAAVAVLAWLLRPPSKVQPVESKPPPAVVLRPMVAAPTNPPVYTSTPTQAVNVAIPVVPPSKPELTAGGFHSPRNPLEAQVALARLGYSAGPIDGAPGSQTRAALRAYQERNHLPATGDLDAATRAQLQVEEPIYTTFITTAEDLARLRPVGKSWLEKSEQPALDYETLVEMVAEKFRCAEGLVRALNPGVVWTNPAPGLMLKVPNAYAPEVPEKAAFVRIHLAGRSLEAFDTQTNVIAHFPCSIAQRVDKRPVGRLTVTKAVANPNYLFNPEIFSESSEAQAIGRKLVIPPGPNNPVGTAWISLDRPGYGIHGTPRPEQVGRTESHGCFRLANWNAEHLLKLVWVGMPVFVDP